MKVQYYSAIFWGIVLSLIVLSLNFDSNEPKEECNQIIQVHRTATVTFEFCLDDCTVRYRDEWRDASMIEIRLFLSQRSDLSAFLKCK